MQGCDIYPDLIALARACNTTADFSTVLERLSSFAEADGCVVWEKFYAGTPNRRYFMLADSFPCGADEPAWYFLPEKTETGEAIEHG